MMTQTPQERETQRSAKLAKIERAMLEDMLNAERDAPIRERFHKYLESEGFAPQATPAPGRCYSGSSAQTLWECYLAATLAERGAK